MIAPALALLLLGASEPPEQAPPVPNDVFAPVDIEAPPSPPRPPPGPPPPPEAPVLELEAATPTPRGDPPPAGNGRIAGGAFTLGLGVVTLAFVVNGYDRKDLPSNPPEVTRTFASLGFVSLGVGTFLVVHGARARGEFDKWRADTGALVRKNGNGLIVLGTLATTFGGATLIAASVAATRNSAALHYNQVRPLIGVGAVGLAAGIGFLSWGLVRHGRYRAWRAQTLVSRSVPTFVPLHRGGGLGLVGRF